MRRRFSRSSNVVTQGLVSYILFNNSVQDLLGRLSFSATGSVSFSQRNNYFGSIYFNGSSYLSSTLNDSWGTNDFSYTVWHQQDVVDANYHGIFENGSWPDTLAMRNQSNGILDVFCMNTEPLVSGNVIRAGEWNFSVLLRKSGVFYLYNNLSLVQQVTKSLNISLGSVGMTIGTSNHSKEQTMTGRVSNFRIYNRALSEDEMKLIFLFESGSTY